MKRAEINYSTKVAELNKLNERLQKAEKALAKKRAIAEKYGVAEWTKEQHLDWLHTVPTSEWGFILNDSDIKKNGAWIDLGMAEDRVAEIEYKIEKAEERLDKAEEELDAYHKELEQIEDLKRKEELFKLAFEEEQKEWAKDGITLTSRYMGYTPSGKSFWITGNNGFTKRSLHCFTLIIDGNTIFTSGEFWRAYGVVLNS